MSEKPLYSSIEKKLKLQFNPIHLEIIDDSSKHRSHQAMVGNTFPETHFKVTIVSSQFEGVALLKRHRMINEILKDEFQRGLHALQLYPKTVQEFEKQSH
jgi:BolA protein